jgi:hypothetical protein
VGPEGTKLQKAVSQFLWFITTARNILVVVFCAVMAYLFEVHGSQPFILTGFVKPGLPPFHPPPFSAQVGNHTYNFLEMVSNLGSATFVVPLLAILENIALAKVFGKYFNVSLSQLSPWSRINNKYMTENVYLLVSCVALIHVNLPASVRMSNFRICITSHILLIHYSH